MTRVYLFAAVTAGGLLVTFHAGRRFGHREHEEWLLSW